MYGSVYGVRRQSQEMVGLAIVQATPAGRLEAEDGRYGILSLAKR